MSVWVHTQVRMYVNGDELELKWPVPLAYAQDSAKVVIYAYHAGVTLEGSGKSEHVSAQVMLGQIAKTHPHAVPGIAKNLGWG